MPELQGRPGPSGPPGIQEAAAIITAQATFRAPPAPRFIPLAAQFPGRDANAALPAPCVAVDGSHAVLLDNGHLWVVATRVAAVTWPGPPAVEPESNMTAVLPDEAQALLDVGYVAWGLEPPRARSAEALAQGLRDLQETQSAVQAVGLMPAGGLVLIDGALRGLPPGPQALSDRILDAGRRRGVAVVGVAKRSGLGAGAAASMPALHEAGPPGAWAVDLGEGTFAARLHPAAAHTFRIDAPDLAAVARLRPYCRDAIYTGYPYPLAVAHNAVALTNAHTRDLRARLREEVRRTGGAPAAALLADFHDVLDRNV